MPSACIKSDKKSSTEPEEAIKQCLSVVEKKVRNLEKRKGKLDTYREQSDKGLTELNEDQKEAITKYDSVLRNLEFARELHKQFNEIHEKAEKLLKRREKFDKQQKHNEEVARIQELLQVQSVLDSMGGEDVRSDFQAGKRGAVTLSEDSLNQLDELYKLISPTRDGEVSYAEQLNTASEHIVNYLDGKDKEVAGTTYKNLKDLISQINQCGYFDKSHSDQSADEAATSTEEAIAEQQPEAPEQVGETEEEKPEETMQAHAVSAAPLQQMIYTEEPTHQQMTTTAAPVVAADLPPVPTLPTAMASSHPAVASFPTEVEQVTQESFFSTEQVERPRGFQQIVSDIAGDFDFLQDSEIDKQNKQEAVHVDPAVVAAHHSIGASLHQQADTLSQSYGNAYPQSSGLLDEQRSSHYQAQQTQQSQTTVDQSLGQSQYAPDTLAAAPLQPTQQSQSAKYGQTASYETSQDTPANQWATPHDHTTETRWSSATDSHTLERSWTQPDQTSGQTQAWAVPATADTSNTNTSQIAAQNWPEPSSSATTTKTQQGSSQPSWGDQSSGSQQGHHQPAWSTGGPTDQSETKTSSLNPNADIFLYQSQQQSSDFSLQDTRSSGGGYDSRKNDDYSDGYQGNYRGRRDYDSRGGSRGRGGPRGGMSNGYRGGNRGGGYRGNDDRRGGGYSDRGPRGGNRGGGYSSSSSSSFQGYPPRNDYQPEGYQGLNNGFSGGFDSSSSSAVGGSVGGGFGGGSKRGGPRGGGGGFRGNNRGGGGGERGRGGRGGSRPNSAHQQ